MVDDRSELHEIEHVQLLSDLAEITWRSTDAVAILSRNHEIDTDALEQVMPLDLSYIGMIGSRKKVRTVFEKLRKRGVDETRLARVYAPIGLDLGADSPGEIAISVLAELMRVRSGCSGKPLSQT